MDDVAGRGGGRIAQHPRAVGVPRHRITPSQHGQRAERVEAPGDVAELCRGSMLPAPHGVLEPALRRDEPRADAGQTSSGIERGELALELPTPPLARTNPRVETMNFSLD